MGRYYNTSTGREGKFMFGVQPSDDPFYMGMGEDPTYIHYYAGEDDIEVVKKKLDEQYDLLGVDKKDRLYDLPRNKGGTDDTEAYYKWEEEVMHDKIWRSVKREDMTEEEKKQVGWSSIKGDEYTDLEIGKGKCLALARIRLGLIILADIEDEGYCSLDAEL